MPELDAKQRLDGEKGDVFVSWTSKDGELKDKVVAYLENESKDLKCLESGKDCCGNFVEWSKSTAKAASVFMLILTENTIDKILKDKQNNRPNYVLEEVHTALKEWGADAAINRIIVICPNDEVYNHPVLWEDLQGSSEGNLLRKGRLSVIYYGTELTDSKLEEIFRKVTNLLIHRFIHKYNNTIMSTNYIKLVPFYKDKHLQKSSDKPYPFDDLYVPRTITEIGANGEVLAELDSPKELVACGDILFLSGPGGSGKTQYLMQLFKSVGDDTVMISLPCFKIANSEKPLFKDMYNDFYEKCGHRDFYSEENFRKLISEKKLLLVLDGVDEIPTETSVRNFLKKVGKFYEPDNENVTLLFTGRNEKDAEYITFQKKTVRKFRLNQLSDEGIKKLGNNLFLMFGNEDKGNEFYVRVKDLNDEIKTNPLLLSQLAIVYNDSGVVPQTIVGIFDAVSAIMLKRDEFKDIEIPQGYQEMVDNLSYWLAAFAAERYSCISCGEPVPALEMFKKLLKQDYKSSYGSRAKFLLEYIRSRAIYIEDNDGNGEFYHKMFSEYFTAVYYCEEAFVDYSKIDKSVISELFGHYSDPYWAKVLQLFLIKADSSINKQKTEELYKLILSENKIKEYTLLFDCCRDLIVHKQEAQTVLVCDILQKSADGVYPPYGPLFWYVPEYGLYETALFAASYLKGNAKALALVRDVCYIYGQKNSIDAITDKISGQELFDAASPDLSGVRRALCEIFYLGDTKYEGGKDIYPRCFNVAETLSFRDYSCGLSRRMKIPFIDELGLYSHTSYNILNGGAIGLVSCPYDAAEIEKKLSGMENFKLRGLILSPTEKERFEFVYFTRINVQVLYLPENIIGTDEDFNRYMPLICDVYANEEGVSYRHLFGDVKLPPLYPVMNFSRFRTIKSVVIAEGVEEIGKSAFEGCSSLKEIKIPEGVKKIGDLAFKGCSSLQEIELPEGVEAIRCSAFEGCSSLQELKIPEGVKEIGEHAFEGCSSLQKIEIPEGVEAIEYYVFKGCSSLQEIELPEGVKEIGWSAFKGCSSLQKIEIPEGVRVIGAAAFSGCSGLQEIEIPEGVRRLDMMHAFNGCSSLQEIKIPEGVREIGNYAFFGCSSLQKIEIPEGVEAIKDSAFAGCRGLKEVKIPEGVKEIGEHAFEDCSSLQEIKIPKGVREIGGFAFAGCSSSQEGEILNGKKTKGYSAFKGCSSLQEITIPEGVETIGNSAFADCTSLQKIEIPEGVKKIGHCAFKNCSSLQYIKIPGSVETIFSGAFEGCSSLQEIEIPEGVKEIGSCEFSGSGAFSGCGSLQKIEIPEGVRRIWNDTFEGCSSLQEIKIPEGVKKIGHCAFKNCSSLQYIKIPESVETIFSCALEGCSSLKQIEIPEGVEYIGDGAFKGCSSLRKITLSDAFEPIVDTLGLDYDVVDIEWVESKSSSKIIFIEDGTEEISVGMFRDSLASRFVIPSSVKKIDAKAFFGCCRIKTIEIPEGVREIGYSAFAGCSSLQKIEIPEGVEKIGESAFYDCSSLQEITIPEGVEVIGDFAFAGCRGLKEVKIPEGVRRLGRHAFEDCSSLQEITIPEGVGGIGDSAFAGCRGLKEVEIPEGVKEIGSGAFSDCSSLQKIEIPEGVKGIENGAFGGCSSLQKIEIPEGVKKIGWRAFEDCRGLREVKIPDGVEKIGWSAFEGCSSLQKVKIPEGVESIWDFAFAGCSSLQEVKIPEGVEAIGVRAFEGCISLQKIEIPEGVRIFSSRVLAGRGISEGVFSGCSSLKEIKIPEGVEEIGSGAFEGCSSLQKIEIAEGVEEIGYAAFAGCSSLQKIEIPEGVKKICGSAFKGCSSLKEIVIPKSVIDIYDNVFKGCIGLESVTISINFKNDIQRIFGYIDSKIIHFI